jgi:ferredoxin
VRDKAVVYREAGSMADFPVGCTDVQEPGRYRIEQGNHSHCFAYAVGPDSWKRFLFPPKIKIFEAARDGGVNRPFHVDIRRTAPPRYAFLGVRACELAAINIQDKISASAMLDAYYKEVRDTAFLVAVNCTEPAGTCFCASMGAGPRCEGRFDLCLTELDGEFSVEVGSERGAAVFHHLTSREATSSERRLYEILIERACEHMGRRLETEGLAELLTRNVESPRWEVIAKRCLACGNCTMVCPTCFCYNVHDQTDLSGRHAERWRLWGSCFTLEFSYLGATTVRTEGFSRYRQWMMHKLSAWHEQFGVSGCVGCGRCITWCPMGIDITEEAAAIRRESARSGNGTVSTTKEARV